MSELGVGLKPLRTPPLIDEGIRVCRDDCRWLVGYTSAEGLRCVLPFFFTVVAIVYLLSSAHRCVKPNRVLNMFYVFSAIFAHDLPMARCSTCLEHVLDGLLLSTVGSIR